MELRRGFLPGLYPGYIASSIHHPGTLLPPYTPLYTLSSLGTLRTHRCWLVYRVTHSVYQERREEALGSRRGEESGQRLVSAQSLS